MPNVCCELVGPCQANGLQTLALAGSEHMAQWIEPAGQSFGGRPTEHQFFIKAGLMPLRGPVHDSVAKDATLTKAVSW